ncbi:MAG TPA: ABC transporter substrate-binding protein [Conexibacter sp.]|jgi:putative hydroxymethylpyrimidine transport system substrate-binding protein|nr:ABC transporter substrate-binding protein [Conexibacter sp.]
MRRLLPLLALLAAVVLLAACGGHSSDRRPNEDATLMLDFTPNAAHAGIYSAVARGFDTAEGVNLKVRVPGSSTDAVKLLLSGRTQFSVMDIHDLALAGARGRDLVAVMAIVQRPLAAVLTTADVKSPRDLEGRKVGVTGLPSDDAVLRSIVAGAGGSYDKVEKVTIGFNAVPALLGGRVAGATAFWNVEGIALKSKRPGTRDFRVDAYGAPSYPELVLVTARSTLRDDPALVHATVRALVRGYGLTVHDPASSLSDLESRVHGLDQAQLAAQLDALTPALSPPGGRIGGFDPQVLARWARWEAQFGIVARPPDVRRLFDTQVVPDSGAASDDAG